MTYYCKHCGHTFELDNYGRITETCEQCGLKAVRID